MEQEDAGNHFPAAHHSGTKQANINIRRQSKRFTWMRGGGGGGFKDPQPLSNGIWDVDVFLSIVWNAGGVICLLLLF